MATPRRKLVRTRSEMEENTEADESDLEVGVGLPAQWSERLGSLLRPGSLGRRWAMCEWFCSPVDAPYLQTSDFITLATARGLHLEPMPRAQWMTVRRAMGRARRFSRAFLKTERDQMLRARDEETLLKRRQSGEAWTRSGARLLAFHPQRREIVCAVSYGYGRGGLWVVFSDESTKRCIPLADAMPAPTPPPPEDTFAPFSLEDLERMATLSALLSSKEACLDAITDMHDRAEAGGMVEQRGYALRVLQLEEINRALVPALAACVSPMMGAKVESAMVEREALNIVTQLAHPLTSAAVRALVLKCLQLCIAIRRGLERMEAGGQAFAEARIQVQSALASMRPTEGSPASAPFREIEKLVASMLR